MSTNRSHSSHEKLLTKGSNSGLTINVTVHNYIDNRNFLMLSNDETDSMQTNKNQKKNTFLRSSDFKKMTFTIFLD